MSNVPAHYYYGANPPAAAPKPRVFTDLDDNVMPIAKRQAPRAKSSAPPPEVQPIGPPPIPDTLKAWVPEPLAGVLNALAEGRSATGEQLLATHVMSLDGVYHSLLERAGQANQGHPEKLAPLLKLALQAQRQCRETLEALARVRPRNNSIYSNS